MSGSTSTNVMRNKNWAKCNISTEIHLKNNLLEIFHNKTKDARFDGLPEDPSALYQYFYDRKYLFGLKGSGKELQLFPDQYKLVLPSNKQEVDSQSFDITLIATLIRKFIPNCPFAATIDEARKFRNKLKHGTLDDFKTEQQLRTNLKTIYDLLKEMNYSKLADFVVADIIKDEKFLIDVEELANLITDLKNDLKNDTDNKIDHARKVMTEDILKTLEHRLKGLFVLLIR